LFPASKGYNSLFIFTIITFFIELSGFILALFLVPDDCLSATASIIVIFFITLTVAIYLTLKGICNLNTFFLKKKILWLIIPWILTGIFISLSFILKPIFIEEINSFIKDTGAISESTSETQITQTIVKKITNTKTLSSTPTSTITPTPTTTSTPIVQWDFKNGCIPAEWVYWPESWSYKVDYEDNYNCMDYSYFGFDAVFDEGLSIVYSKPDGNIKFGISREVPDDFNFFLIRFVWTKLDASNSNTTFKLGFIEAGEDPLAGQLFTIQRKEDTLSPFLYMSDSDLPYPGDYFGYSSSWQENTIQISCDVEPGEKLDCEYTWNDQTESVTHYLSKEWDSIYIGYDIPKDGTIDLLITDLVVW